MMNRNVIGVLAICGTALSPVFSAPALATPLSDPVAEAADGNTLAAMQDQCDAIAATYKVGQNETSGQVLLGFPTLVSGPTEVPGSRVIDEATVEGAGIFTPEGVFIDGDPYRVGGSVNMFGIQRATGGSWSASTYEYDADFDSTFSWPFDCEVSEQEFIPGFTTPVEGFYTNPQDNSQGDCAGLSPSHHKWGEDIGACIFTQTGGGEDVPDDLGDPVVVALVPGVPVDQDQTDNLRGFEANGSGFSIGGDVLIGQVVVCNSPSGTGKKGNPGEWRAQNGYDGELCTTAHFDVAEWGSGSETSNGTYISVPPQ